MFKVFNMYFMTDFESLSKRSKSTARVMTNKRRKLVFVGIAVAIGLFLVLAATSDPAPADTPFVSLEKSPGNKPVIASGVDGLPAFMSDPCVIKDEEGYHAFFTNLFFSKNGQYWLSYDPSDPDAFDISVQMGTVAYAFSDDQGLTWNLRDTPCALSGPAAWQDDDLETPFVLRQGDRLVLFYSALGSRDGAPFSFRYQIGAATLDLGGRTIRQALLEDAAVFANRTEPVLPYNTEAVHHDNNTQEPSAILKDGRIELFYTGLTLAKPDKPIPGVPGQAIKKVALYRAVLDADLRVIKPAEEALIEGGNIAEVHYRDDVYHCFSTKSRPWWASWPGKEEGLDDFHYNERIIYHRSADGETWIGGQTILEKGPEESFDNWGIMAPTVVFDDDKVVLFYTAWQIGEQIMDPLPPDGRFGMRRGASHTIWGALGRAEAAYAPPGAAARDPSGDGAPQSQ
jgi:hypothetical protein